MKVLKFRTFDEKREITPRWVIIFTSKFTGHVDLFLTRTF